MISERQIADLFTQGFDCSQVVFTSVVGKFGMDAGTAYRLSAGFGGGMMRGQTCGAVVGAIMALGLKYGHHEPNTPDRKNLMMAKTVEFQQRFMDIYPSTGCRELLGYDVNNPDEMKIILDKGLFFDFCPKVVAHSIRVLEELI